MSALSDEIKTAVRDALRDELPRLLSNLKSPSESSRRGSIGVPEAAVLCNRHPDTIRRAIKSGKLQAMRPHGAREWILRAEDVDEWVRGEGSAEKPDLRADVEAAVARALDCRAD